VQEAPARSWLFAIASRKLVDSYRRGRVEADARRRLGMEPIALTDDRLERIAEDASQWTEASLMRYLNELPAEQRSAVLGRVVDEQSYEELATQLQCSEAVVRQRVSRGLGRLRSRMRGVS
jgi:RNA polymerase sigma-70 factor (ECF subfamily)